MNSAVHFIALSLMFAATTASADPVYLRCQNLELPPNDPNYITLTVDLATSAASVTWHFAASVAGPAGARTMPFQIQRSDEGSINATTADGYAFTLDRLSGQTLLTQGGPGKRLDSSLACQPTKPVL